jgi:hypothetical protein
MAWCLVKAQGQLYLLLYLYRKELFMRQYTAILAVDELKLQILVRSSIKNSYNAQKSNRIVHKSQSTKDTRH